MKESTYWKSARNSGTMLAQHVKVRYMEYAIIRTGGKQYRVKQGDVIAVDKLPVVKEAITTFNDVLLLVSDGQVLIGTPVLSGAAVKAKVLDQIKGDKIRVSKFKSKVRYRRVTGFRPLLTRVRIEDISSDGSSQSRSAASPKSGTTESTRVKRGRRRSRPSN